MLFRSRRPVYRRLQNFEILMQVSDFCAYCLSLNGVEVITPFGPEVLVYKVGGKMFATAVPDELPHRVNLKCDPERSLDLRDRFEDIVAGYHMNKKHWNTVIIDNTLNKKQLKELIDHSYDLVCNGKSKPAKSKK